MEEKKMRELSLEEMDKTSGGKGCSNHDWIYIPASDMWQCPKCGTCKSSGGMPWSNSKTAPADSPF
jgi:hypothetical protein